MVYLAALAIYLLISAVVWFVGLAVYQSLAGGPDLRKHPYFVSSTCVRSRRTGCSSRSRSILVAR